MAAEPHPFKQLKGTDPVEALDLSGKGLGMLSTIVIATLIEFNAVLSDLSLRGNNLGSQGAAAIADALKSGKSVLTKLDIRGNFMGKAGEQRLRNAVTRRDGFELLM